MSQSYPLAWVRRSLSTVGHHGRVPLSRRAVLVGGTATLGVSAAGAVGIQQGVLPGRPQVQALLGLNGAAGVVPDVDPGPIVSGTFVSERRLGAATGWSLVRPPGGAGSLPLLVALHGLNRGHEDLMGPDFGLPQFLAAAVRDNIPPFAIVAVDGGTTYWHERPTGEDAGAMVVEELLPMLAERDVQVDRIGLLGWSMGGYGALHLAGLLGPDRVAAVAATSPAIWTDPDDARPSGFEDAEEYAEFSVIGRQGELIGIPVRIDCGTGDPFYRAVKDYTDGFPDEADVTHTFGPGAHDAAYWRRMLPEQLEFLGVGLRA